MDSGDKAFAIFACALALAGIVGMLCSVYRDTHAPVPAVSVEGAGTGRAK